MIPMGSPFTSLLCDRIPSDSHSVASVPQQRVLQVIASDGYVYEREAIEYLFRNPDCASVSPMTREPLQTVVRADAQPSRF